MVILYTKTVDGLGTVFHVKQCLLEKWDFEKSDTLLKTPVINNSILQKSRVIE